MTRDGSDLLERLERQLPADPEAFERLAERRDRKLVHRRVGGSVVGLGLTAVILAAFVASITGALDRDDRDRAADARWAEVPAVPGPGQYFYVRFVWPGNGTVQLWLAADGSGRRVWKGGAGPTDESYGAAEGTELWLVPELSTDPEQLLQQLIERSGPGGASPVPIATTSPGRSEQDTSVLRAMSDLLTFDSLLMPGQVQALFGAAQRIDGVATAEGVMDPWGRPALSVTHVIDYESDAGHDLVWYFDPRTGQYLGEAWVNLRTGRTGSATIVELSGIVDSDHEVPRGEETLIPEASDAP